MRPTIRICVWIIIGCRLPTGIRGTSGGVAQSEQGHRSKTAAELAAWNELNRLYAHLYNAHRKATAYKNEILPSCREVFGASQISYDEGKIDYLTLLDAQRTYFESQIEYLDALADYHLYRTELER
jgi:cobalt-zinc-cadmium efflux system outer membrane protein